MQVKELIKRLSNLPKDATVVVYNNEWGDYGEINRVVLKSIVIAVAKTEKDNSPAKYFYAEGETPLRYKRAVGMELMVVIG